MSLELNGADHSHEVIFPPGSYFGMREGTLVEVQSTMSGYTVIYPTGYDLKSSSDEPFHFDNGVTAIAIPLPDKVEPLNVDTVPIC